MPTIWTLAHEVDHTTMSKVSYVHEHNVSVMTRTGKHNSVIHRAQEHSILYVAQFLGIMCQGLITGIQYCRKYCRELNLAVGSQIIIVDMLT